ncbi:MAG: hypothetical protein ACREVK_14025 [Gammaproteobacteria bacterium]
MARDERRLKDAPAFTINLAADDSLLHGRRFNELGLDGEAENLARGGLVHVYQIEDLDETTASSANSTMWWSAIRPISRSRTRR